MKELRPAILKDAQPESYVELMKKCWAQKPEDRPDMSEVVKQIDVVGNSLSSFGNTK
jgi:hypothetical protein